MQNVSEKPTPPAPTSACGAEGSGEQTPGQVGAKGPEESRRRAWGAAALFVAAVLLRLALPFAATDTYLVHSSIVDSALAGQTWGRQALVGSLEYPLLPTLLLLSVRVLLAPLGVSAIHWLVAVSQVWALTYLLRLSSCRRLRLLGLAAAGFSLLSPTVRDVVQALDPNWILAVPMASTVYHLAAWHRERELRDAVLCGVNCGLLGFCGFGGILFAVCVLGMMCKEVRQVSRVSPDEQSGVKLLLWAPFAYCAFLWLLWNWLIMGNMLFCLERVVDASRAFTLGETLSAVGAALRGCSLLLPVALVGVFLTLGTPLWGIAVCLGVGLVGIIVVHSLCLSLELYAGGAGLAAVFCAFSCLVLPWMSGLRCGGALWRDRLLWARLLLVAGVLLTVLAPGRSLIAAGAFAADAPPSEEITGWIDRFWPDSRTAVYGIRLPAVYHDPLEKRFVARMDYNRHVFLEQAVDEQMHLLLPPPDGRFYVRRVSPFASIHAEGTRWLFLEKQWESGWQLWRCVIPPEGESKLQELR